MSTYLLCQRAPANTISLPMSRRVRLRYVDQLWPNGYGPFCATLSFDPTTLRLPFFSLEPARAPTYILFMSFARPDALLPSTLLVLKGLMQCEDGTEVAHALCKKPILGNVLLGKQIHPDRCKRRRSKGLDLCPERRNVFVVHLGTYGPSNLSLSINEHGSRRSETLAFEVRSP